jgi:hypothetical protein
MAEALVAAITERAESVQPEHMSQGTAQTLVAAVARRAQALLDSWERIVLSARHAEAGKRCYSPFDAGQNGKALLHTALDEDARKAADADDRRFAAPTSMRDVEPSVHVWLNLRPEGRS